ncbi:uncharacterized protein G2W53_000882 [Senna tora]|uniref:Uncharacterized protein n=1 Tax=Senna tora TaxID=362788 RepID=A0A835CM22_9FABA|nr:uncharacterized protein G2W53_000882 [Senna tora]
MLPDLKLVARNSEPSCSRGVGEVNKQMEASIWEKEKTKRRFIAREEHK